MTPSQRETLEKFAGGDRPLNKAIAAALAELDRAETCRQCNGEGGHWRGDGTCSICAACDGTGRRR